MRHTGVSVLLSLLPFVAAGQASSIPGATSALPPVTAQDVTGQTHDLGDLIQGPTLLVAITDRHAGDAMRAWFQSAETRVPEANQVSIISIGVPFFVSDGYARSRAREQVPRRWWHASLFDTDHAMARKLGLQEDELPYVFAMSGDGRVLARAHGMPGDPQAERVWSALRGLRADHPLGARQDASAR